ncbi:MAG: hypothetical protein Q8Q67_04240 [bacterium]|nr:hypothetical protein [bacterium]
MRKKVAERLRPYLALADSEADLQKLIESLSPPQLGETKDLIDRYVQEVEAKANAEIAKTKFASNHEFILFQLNKPKKVQSIIADAFNLRKMRKLEKRLSS